MCGCPARPAISSSGTRRSTSPRTTSGTPSRDLRDRRQDAVSRTRQRKQPGDLRGPDMEVGPGVTRVAPGDHVVCSFIPNCGVCRYCATGRQSICDMGATILEGYLPGERFPITGPRSQYCAQCMIGTFSQYGVISQTSAIKVDDDLPLDKAVLVGCGVPTGWGSAVNTANVSPGDTVAIYGIGGIGIDPLENKREKAMELGATHAFATAEEAQEAITQMTRGQGADSAILTVD